jgi:hypothetical protein
MTKLIVPDFVLRDRSFNQRSLEECFDNCDPDHILTDVATRQPFLWFVGMTNSGELIRIAFLASSSAILVKHAREATERDITLFRENFPLPTDGAKDDFDEN